MAILPVKSPSTLTIIARGAPLVLLVVTGHGGCCHIFVIWDNRLSSHPFWKLVYGLLGCVTTRAMARWPAVFLDVALFTTLVTSPIIWPGKWPSSRSTTISTAVAFEINLVQSLVDRLLNCHSLCLGSKGWSWDFSLLVAGSHHFESTRSRYSRVASCTKDS